MAPRERPERERRRIRLGTDNRMPLIGENVCGETA